MTHMFY